MRPASQRFIIQSCIYLRILIISQAARQGLAMLTASAVVVLKHETSTLRQRHNVILIDFKFGVGDLHNVMEVTNSDKVSSGPMSDQDATWEQHIRVL